MKKVTFCLLMIVSVLLSNIIFGAIPAEERAALIDFYNSSNGDSWEYNSRWKMGPSHTDGFALPGTEGKWLGVTISGDHVIKLSLENNRLAGSISPGLGNLRYLEELLLGNSILVDAEHWNQLSGEIPTQLGALLNLRRLDLRHNHLTGGIPIGFGNFSQLERLVLFENQLSGEIPHELGNLKNLQILELFNNQLSGAIPSELGNLKKLFEFSLSNNRLSGEIPSELGNLRHLTWFLLGNNRLSGSIPPELGNLIELEELDLSHNRLSGKIPSELGNIKWLEHLYLNNNQLSGSIPSSFMNFAGIFNLDFSYNCLYAADPTLKAWLDTRLPGWEAFQNQCTPKISLNRTQLNFGCIVSSEIKSGAQKIRISNIGSGTLNWIATSDAFTGWLNFEPRSGTGDATLPVWISGEWRVGTFHGFINIEDINASNSPQTINVTMNVYEQGKTSAPFGEFSTPMEGAAVYNSVPVTGWVLDDIGVSSVKIYNGETYLGDATFVEGARPDVEAAYPTYPNNYNAGWGYMLLTHSLPNGGNGTYTLIAKATDIEGNEVTLGTKTITIDNAHAVKPFGAIDTPEQGGPAAGKDFVNFGWALTPQPNTIPVDGSMINVIIDGVVKGHPVYNNYRSDIAALYPGYANTNGAIGYYYIDTTKLEDGVHTIAWNVTDNAGNSDGIGSRYFTVMNKRASSASLSSELSDTNNTYSLQNAKTSEELHFEIKELERIQLPVAGPRLPVEGYLVVGDQLRILPIGSTLDTKSGVFYWQPGPGFVGEYRFVFIGKDDNGQCTKKNIVVNIKPR